MSSVDIALLSIVGVLILVYSGMHIAVALGLLSFVCIWAVRGNFMIAGKMLSMAASESLAQYDFGVVPLFVMMGILVSVSDIGRDTYDVANQIFRRVRGGLGTATVAANAVFAAVTGTSIASASVFTKIAVPEMLRHGYNPRFAVGVVAGSSVLGMLIPPSLLFILFGILAETSIGHLFIAGIVPGILLAVAYCSLIWFLATRYPRYVKLSGPMTGISGPLMSAQTTFLKSVPIILLIVLVIGGIYGGIFTATEAGGVGAAGALILSLIKRRLTWKTAWHVLVETGHVTAAICFLLIAANVYSRMIAVSGLPNAIEHGAAHLSLGMYEILAIYIVILLLLGTIIDAGSIMLITVPLIVPLMAPFGISTVWLGVVTVIAVEVGLLTPPFGLAVFVVHSTLRDARISVHDIFMGSLPFAVVMCIVLGLVVAFPRLALILL
jgi:C4-dicarboxylate transporter DctM subunit